MRAAPAPLLVALVLTGCGGPSREEAVTTAQTWLKAVADQQPDRACDLMRPSAVQVLSKRFSDLGDKPDCREVVEAYRDAFSDADLRALTGGRLEAEGPVKDDEVGVFPVSGPRHLQVILMQHGDDGWKVGSTTLSP